MSLSPPALLPEAERVDLIRVWKARRWMAVYHGGIERAAFPVALGFAPQEHRREQGDGRTPEGEYIISGRNPRNPRSRFHLSLRVSYPGPDDARQVRERGVDPGKTSWSTARRPGATAIGRRVASPCRTRMSSGCGSAWPSARAS